MTATSKSHQPNYKLITLLTLLTRILLSLLTRTFFQPDEYFQSLEPAHRIVFGYGHLTWEWLAQNPIRSVVYSGLNVPIYWVLKKRGWDGGIMLIAGPKILHGALASLTDIGLCRLTSVLLGERYVYTALLLSLSSFFHALSLSRSLSNSLETSLTIMALSYYPWSGILDRKKVRSMLAFAALACAIRPTNALIWAYVVGALLLSHRRNARSIIVDGLLIAIPSALLILTLDSLYYGKLVFTPLNFILTNLSSVSSFYGMSSWHYYLTQGLPILCTTCLPFTLHGAWRAWRAPRNHKAGEKMLLGLMTWTIAVYSAAKHKEWRFIHPLLPIFHVFAAKSLVDTYTADMKMQGEKDNAKTESQSLISTYLPIRTSSLILILSTLPITLYVVTSYCSGPISLMTYLRSLPPTELAEGGVGFLLPCHSTPWQAYLHRPDAEGKIWALGCEPPLGDIDIKTYKDQTDIFFQDPVRYLLDRFPDEVNATFPESPYPRTEPGSSSPHSQMKGLGLDPDGWRHEWPRYLALFGALLEQDQDVGAGVREVLMMRGYEEVWRAGREWEGEGKRKGGVRVWRWTS